jgi:hypothetical protein
LSNAKNLGKKSNELMLEYCYEKFFRSQ